MGYSAPPSARGPKHPITPTERQQYLAHPHYVQAVRVPLILCIAFVGATLIYGWLISYGPLSGNPLNKLSEITILYWSAVAVSTLTTVAFTNAWCVPTLKAMCATPPNMGAAIAVYSLAGAIANHPPLAYVVIPLAMGEVPAILSTVGKLFGLSLADGLTGIGLSIGLLLYVYRRVSRLNGDIAIAQIQQFTSTQPSQLGQ